MTNMMKRRTENKMDNKMKEIAEKMAEEGMPMANLKWLFIHEPLSLEGLLMIEDKGPMIIDQVYKEFTGAIQIDINVTRLLDKLKTFGVIDIKDDIVNITDRGHCIVMKLRKKMNNLDKDIDASLCNIKHDCVYNVDNCYEL